MGVEALDFEEGLLLFGLVVVVHVIIGVIFCCDAGDSRSRADVVFCSLLLGRGSEEEEAGFVGEEEDAAQPRHDDLRSITPPPSLATLLLLVPLLPSRG